MSIADAVLDRLLQVNPRQQAEALLSLIASHSGAETSALFRVTAKDARPELFVARMVDQAALDNAAECWSTDSHRLGDGEPVDGPGYLVIGIPGGLVYLSGKLPISRERAQEVVGAAKRALSFAIGWREAVAEPTVVEWLASRSASEIRREKLLQVLRDAGWNKAKAARIWGCSRATMYNMMESLGIPLDERVGK